MIETISILDKEPRLTLVGAGPGDPELITVKAINAVKHADVVLYDALVAAAILELIPKGIPAFSVGKRAGEHSYSQEEINELIVDFAYRYGHVVRLKGGDPFVFGRGSEEIEYAEAHGVHTTVIPGISSAIAVPASLKIPVTARGISESFWVVTGTTKSGAISGDIALAAQSTATIVILMGLNKLETIMATFAAHGKADIPVAVVQNGSLPDQKSVIGTVESIAAAAAQSGIGAPAIIIVGEVVRYAQALEKVIVASKSIA
ncbi:MAG TPA: uroporphyrinogen-III C-methyltransferase [Ohtaekwangia sp.]|uniref:uroporphyrinogen-III C-methyltransferase n=1 Tax=Ohtaekwangia sp. TaxID=2066019 RepID=UPI002F927C63